MILGCSQKSPLPTDQLTGSIPAATGISSCIPFTVQTTDSSTLSCRISYPEGETKAVLYMVHGLGQYQDTYCDMCCFLLECGYAVVTYDLRGHGDSPGARGHIVSLEQQCLDINALLQGTDKLLPDTPRFIYGHSFGGAVALNYILKNPEQFHGAILAPPFIRSAKKIPQWKLVLGSVLGDIWPTATVGTGIDMHDITRDSLHNVRDSEDPVSHSYVTAAYLEVFQAGNWALEEAVLATPVLIMHGTEDKVACIEASRELFRNSNGFAELKEWEGQYHELHHDLDKEQIFTYAFKWIEKHRVIPRDQRFFWYSIEKDQQ